MQTRRIILYTPELHFNQALNNNRHSIITILNLMSCCMFLIEPQHDKMICAPSEDSDKTGHLSSLIRVFTVRIQKPLVLGYPLSAQRRLWSDSADAQADLSLQWAHVILLVLSCCGSIYLTIDLLHVYITACFCMLMSFSPEYNWHR